MHTDLGGSRAATCAPRPPAWASPRCEVCLLRHPGLCHTLTNDYQDELHRPAFPYKSSSSSTAAPTAAWPPSPGPICRSSAPGRTTSASTRDGSRPSGRRIQAGRRSIPAATGVPSTSRKWWTAVPPAAELRRLQAHHRQSNCTRCMHASTPCRRPSRSEGNRRLPLVGPSPIWTATQMASLLCLHPGGKPYTEIKEVIENIWDWWREARTGSAGG